MANRGLNARKAEAFSAPPGERASLNDDITPGLSLRVSQTGKKSWAIRYRINGRERRRRIGRYPQMRLAEARVEARQQMSIVDAGEDPAHQLDAPEDRSFKAMAAEVLEARAHRTRERTAKDRARTVARELIPGWGDRDAASIRRREVVHLVEAIVRRGAPVGANRVLSLIRLIFNDGIRRGWPGLESNPAHLVQPPGEEHGRDTEGPVAVELHDLTLLGFDALA